METYIAVGTNAVTAAFAIPRPDARVALAVPSLGRANVVTVDFTVTSGAGPYHPLQREDGSGQVFLVHSGAGPAVCPLPRVPTRHGQLRLSSGPTVVASFTLLTLASRW